MLVQIKGTKTKDTLSCAEATHRCPARLRPQAGQPETRCAQTSGRLDPLAARAARRCAQGGLIQTKTGSLTLRQDRKAIFVGQCRRQVRPERSHPIQPLLGSCSNGDSRAAAPVFGPLVKRREAQGRRVSGALRRCGQLFERRQSDASSGRIPSDRASQCTGAPRRRVTRVSFLLVTSLWTSKEK